MQTPEGLTPNSTPFHCIRVCYKHLGWGLKNQCPTSTGFPEFYHSLLSWYQRLVPVALAGCLQTECSRRSRKGSLRPLHGSQQGQRPAPLARASCRPIWCGWWWTVGTSTVVHQGTLEGSRKLRWFIQPMKSFLGISKLFLLLFLF